MEKQVESGSMKLADEKRALQEISTCKRSRRTVEGFEAEHSFIEAERQKIAELRTELDDPASKQVSERYDSIKAELDELKKESDEAYAGRSKLFEERDDIQNQLQAAFNKKRESSQLFREANDRYWTKVNDDRARRAERARAQRAAEELQKKQEMAERLREEAQSPAFQAQIEDCQTLIDYFTGKSTGNITYKSTPLAVRPEVAGVPKLELRKVEESPAGLVVHKKKGDEEDAYFVSNKKNKTKKGSSKANGTGTSTPTSPTNANTSLNVPLPTLTALLSLSIPPPASNLDLPRLIENLNTKKVWFEANQARVTAENIAKAEADILRLTSHKGDSSKPAVSEGVDINIVEPVPVVEETQTEEVIWYVMPCAWKNLGFRDFYYWLGLHILTKLISPNGSRMKLNKQKIGDIKLRITSTIKNKLLRFSTSFRKKKQATQFDTKVGQWYERERQEDRVNKKYWKKEKKMS